MIDLLQIELIAILFEYVDKLRKNISKIMNTSHFKFLF